jgi:hypothetical protein
MLGVGVDVATRVGVARGVADGVAWLTTTGVSTRAAPHADRNAPKRRKTNALDMVSRSI